MERKVLSIFLIMLSLCVIGLIDNAVAGALTMGYPEPGSESATGGSWCFISNFTLSMSESMSAHQFVLEEMSIYANGIDEDARLRAAIYDANYIVVAYGEWVDIPAGYSWVTSTFDDCELFSANYLYAIEFHGNVTYHVLDSGANGYTINVLSDYLEGLNAWSTYAVRAYGVGYTLELGQSADDPLDAGPGTWAMGYTFGLFLVLGMSLLLFWLRVPVVMFVWAMISLGIAASTWGTEQILFAPYLQIGMMLVSFLLALRATQIYRGDL